MSRANPEADWERLAAPMELSRSQVEALVGPVMPELRGWRLLGGGLANTTVLAEGADGSALVLRLLQREPAAAAREAKLLRLLAPELPVPRVLYEGPDHLLLSVEPGRPMVDLLSEGEARAMGRSAGELLARLHRHVQPAAGDLDAALRVTEPWSDLGTVWSGYLDGLLCGQAGSRLGPERCAAIRALENPEPGPIVLCHGDYKPTNLLADGRRVTAVLDWEFAFAGDPCFDLGQLLRWADRGSPDFEPGVLEGYGELPPGGLRKAALLDLVNLVAFLDGPARPQVHADCLERVDRSLARL